MPPLPLEDCTAAGLGALALASPVVPTLTRNPRVR